MGFSASMKILEPLSADDRRVWRHAIASLSGLRVQHGLDEAKLTAAVGAALHRSATNRACEDCGVKQPSFGLPSERKARWCVGCIKGHVGAVNVLKKKCEGCNVKAANYGLSTEKKARWCAGCAPAKAANVNNLIKCEGCQLKRASFGLPSENGKKRWCGSCARDQMGAVNVEKKGCEDCGLTRPSFGLPSEGKMRWCSGCAKKHVGAVNIKAGTGPPQRSAANPIRAAPKALSGGAAKGAKPVAVAKPVAKPTQKKPTPKKATPTKALSGGAAQKKKVVQKKPTPKKAEKKKASVKKAPPAVSAEPIAPVRSTRARRE